MKKTRKPLWIYRLLIARLFVGLLILAQIVLIVSTIIHYKQLQWLNNCMNAISFITAIHLLTRRDEKSTLKTTLIFLIFLRKVFLELR